MISTITRYRQLNCTNKNLSRCYGLSKIHKPCFPLRIIVSALGSPLYNVADFHDILHQSETSHIKVSYKGWSFAKSICNKNINSKEILISLVTALFTNIPKELILKGIEKR